MFITRARHEREIAKMLADMAAERDSARDTHDKTARTLAHYSDRNAVLQREVDNAVATRDAARADLAMWRDTAREALRSLAALQLRYAPPEPIVGEVEQPPSVDAADREAVEAAREMAEVEA